MPKQNTSPADYPQAVLQQIESLGQNIAIARKRRGESQAQWARRLGVSQPTMARIERGDPSVAMASYVMCMWLINPAVAVADLVAPQTDHAALEREIVRARKTRSGTKRNSHDEGVAASEGQDSHRARAKSSIPADKERSTRSPVDFLKTGALDRYENELESLSKSLAGGSMASAAEEFAELHAMGSGEDELRKLQKSLAGGSVASAAEEFAKLHARGSWEDELKKLQKSFAVGSVASAAEQFANFSALKSYEDEYEKHKQSSVGGSVANGLAALLLKRQSGLK